MPLGWAVWRRQLPNMIETKRIADRKYADCIKNKSVRIIRYIILYNLMWCISIAMCYSDCLINNINYIVQDFLITFFELLAWVVLIIGAIDTFPKDKYSNKRVWFFTMPS